MCDKYYYATKSGALLQIDDIKSICLNKKEEVKILISGFYLSSLTNALMHLI